MHLILTDEGAQVVEAALEESLSHLRTRMEKNSSDVDRARRERAVTAIRKILQQFRDARARAHHLGVRQRLGARPPFRRPTQSIRSPAPGRSGHAGSQVLSVGELHDRPLSKC